MFGADGRFYNRAFDLDRDGKLDCGERAFMFATFEEANRSFNDIDDDEWLDDEDDWDDDIEWLD